MRDQEGLQTRANREAMGQLTTGILLKLHN